MICLSTSYRHNRKIFVATLETYREILLSPSGKSGLNLFDFLTFISYYILLTQEIKRSIVDFSFFIKGSFVHIIT